MSKLNKDILFLLFEELQDDSKSLFSCLMVNRLWCETIIPILWKNPWRYSINYKKSSLYYVITCYLTDDIKGFLTMQGIQLPQISCKSLLFDYLSFCKSINVGIINNITSFGSSSGYDQFLLGQEFYNVLIRKCTELKCLDMRSIEHQIFYFPEAKIRLNSLCELKCDNSINPSFFYGLSYICKNIQRLIIINIYPQKNDGIVKLIEVQKDLKYFEWKDKFNEFADFFYEEFFLALAKKADTLNYLTIYFQQVDNYEHIFLEKVLPEFHKLKTLKIDDFYLCNEENLKKLVCHDLEVFSVDYITTDTVAYIVEHSGGNLRKILLKYHYYYDLYEVDASLTLIRKIYENCPLVEYLSLAFPPSKEHFAEFKKLLKACQNLRSLLLIISDVNVDETQENSYKHGETLLEILIEFAPTNLREVRFLGSFKISLETLNTFLEKWKGRPALSILTSDDVYSNGKDYVNLINKYKTNSIIKDFRYDHEENIYF